MKNTEEQKQYHILVVEDDIPTLEAIGHKLSTAGFVIESATDGQTALGRLQGGAYDGVLLDLRMPVRDGFWFLEEKNKDPSVASCPVVIFTNLAGEEQLRRALDLGVRGYLKKSKHSIQEIVGEVRTCMETGKCRIDY
mgnify:FL=1